MGFGLSTGWLLCLVTKSLTQNLLKEFMFHNYMQNVTGIQIQS